MNQPFRSFVIFAEMRTGSNLLEATMNAVRRVTCFGEAFNPYMLGWPDTETLRGMTMQERDDDPLKLLGLLMDKPQHLPGFRYFHDHDPRVLDAIMAERSCAKIILTRNPLDSYVSTRLAWETNQWKLNETETPIPARIRFDPEEFRKTLGQVEDFLARIQHGLQVTGQSAFWLNYDDLRDPEVMTGMLHWLGRTDLERVNPANDQVPQNPREMAEKVENYDEMQAELQKMDPFSLQRIPTFEPRRGPAVPSFMASEAGSGLIFMPVRGGPGETVSDWLRGLGKTRQDFTQNSLRQWKRDHSGHRSFTILRHPARRAWDVFRNLITGGRAAELRQLMRDTHRIALPEDEALSRLVPSDMAEIFEQFLGFLRRNLNGQTTLATHPGWASQTEVLAGFARFSTPDVILREETLDRDIGWLATAVGLDPDKVGAPLVGSFPGFLDDPQILKAARAAYLRDYVTFGFDDPA
ncbi:sulfotransferase family protein [Paracoccus sp. M683]|uniref:sulfotransferase family protein n=1 Tax=Paracoccus sp. M683 TaxID=2594268 RepID=UPI0011815722|nr:sulfotransferase family protein [Paracoccus sp. M683]TRW98653.1 sulfotransferase family protein [Paracoccus sp. M683]